MRETASRALAIVLTGALGTLATFATFATARSRVLDAQPSAVLREGVRAAVEVTAMDIDVVATKGGEGEEKATTPKSTTVIWEGELKREQWNLFSLKVLTRLAQAKNVNINVRVSAELPEGQSPDQLNSSIQELGIEGRFTRE